MDCRRLAVLLVGFACVASEAVAQPGPGSVSECASVVASVRLQAYGYAHVVTLQNHCQRAVLCQVWTNVDPAPRHTLMAKPGQSAEVVTRSGSPSREVQAGKQCQFAPGG